jgi:hypothetical protein
MNYKSGLFTVFALLSLSFVRGASGETFDSSHKLYGEVLSIYVKDGLVDYSGLKSNPRDLGAYLESTAQVTRREFEGSTGEEQLAFLINLYNARTLQLVVDNYPVKSIRDTGSGAKGPWDIDFIPLFGEKISLNTLENGIIRKQYREPRVHFVLVCAAMGCPPLLSEPYVADKLDKQLETQTKKFLGDPLRNSVDRGNKILRLSPIFEWYKADFEAVSGSVQDFLKTYYADVPLGEYGIAYTDYDWSLNDTSARVK